MASQGPLFPGTVTTEIGPSGDNDWTSPGNISANDGAEAQITAATYDANDHSWRLKAQNFGFTIPSGSTIDGIVVEIEQRAFAGAAEDQEVRLFDDTGTLVGDDKQTATAWPGTATIASYGGTTDDWLPAGSWTPAQINDPDFGVAHIVLATAANTDIGVDFIRVTVHYTPPPGQTIALNQAIETDASQAMGKAKFAALGLIGETDLSQALGRLKVLAAGQVTETELAQAITLQSGQTIPVGLVAEIDAAQAFAKSKVRALLQAVESSTAQGFGVTKVLSVGQVLETDLSQAFGRLKAKGIGNPIEVDAVQTLGRFKTRITGQAAEADSAMALVVPIVLPLGQAAAADLALALGAMKIWPPKRYIVTYLGAPVYEGGDTNITVFTRKVP